MQTDSPQASTTVPTAGSSGRLDLAYQIGFAFLIHLQAASALLDASNQGLVLSPRNAAVVVWSAILGDVIFAIPAGLLTVIGAIWVKKDRGLLFAKSLFFLMAITLVPGFALNLFRFYSGG
jgi:hypothetical protein